MVWYIPAIDKIAVRLIYLFVLNNNTGVRYVFHNGIRRQRKEEFDSW